MGMEMEIDSNPMMIINNAEIEAPPNGTLSTLWYSREIALHLWVIDKIIGWKRRPKLQLQYMNDEVT